MRMFVLPRRETGSRVTGGKHGNWDELVPLFSRAGVCCAAGETLVRAAFMTVTGGMTEEPHGSL